MGNEYKLEVICCNAEDCRIAAKNTVDRIELCDNYFEGGTTPSYGFIVFSRKIIRQELYIIIRPRGGNFIFSDEEFAIMKTDIKVAKNLGCDGIVTGILSSDQTVNKQRMSLVVELAYPMGVTFHRAFDRVTDHAAALEDIIDTGCERILTSGLQSTALEGAALIRNLIEQSSERIIIMPGAGIRSSNFVSVIKETKAKEFHSSCRLTKPHRNFQDPFSDNLPCGIDKDELVEMLGILKIDHHTDG